MLGACISGITAAAAPEPLASTRPAAFAATPKSLKNLIRFPDGSEDVLVRINCDSAILGAGYVLGTFCIATDNRYARFERAVLKAARFAVLDPAWVDGKREDVRFQFRVEFERRGGQSQVRIYPNQGLQVTTFGADYSGPQRVMAFRRSFFAESCPQDSQLWVTATISEEGKPEAIAVEARGKGDIACRQTLLESVQRSRFVPAAVAGRPVRALYRELFF